MVYSLLFILTHRLVPAFPTLVPIGCSYVAADWTSGFVWVVVKAETAFVFFEGSTAILTFIGLNHQKTIV